MPYWPASLANWWTQVSMSDIFPSKNIKSDKQRHLKQISGLHTNLHTYVHKHRSKNSHTGDTHIWGAHIHIHLIFTHETHTQEIYTYEMHTQEIHTLMRCTHIWDTNTHEMHTHMRCIHICTHMRCTHLHTHTLKHTWETHISLKTEKEAALRQRSHMLTLPSLSSPNTPSCPHYQEWVCFKTILEVGFAILLLCAFVVCCFYLKVWIKK